MGRKTLATGLALACLAGFGAWLYVRNAPGNEASTLDSATAERDEVDYQTFNYVTAQLVLHDRTFTLQVADDKEKKSVGLAGGRQSLAEDEGMVFTYETPGTQCFWMKDMQFSIDILWLDAQRRVGYIEPSLSPDTYPQTYCPNVEALYVVELPAGAAKAAGIEIGDTLNLKL